MSKFCFETELIEIKEWQIILLPVNESQKLPTRGMTLVSGTLNQIPFETELEPDGNGSHWFRVSETLAKKAMLNLGDVATVCIAPLNVWFEPQVPVDLTDALVNADLLEMWQSLTTKARWEWVRWIRFTNNPETRQKRIEVTCSKLDSGKKRPCCFDLSRCTETSVSKSGVLIQPIKYK